MSENDEDGNETMNGNGNTNGNTGENEDTERTDFEQPVTAAGNEAPGADMPSTDPRIDDLRSMNEETAHLNEVIEETQDAVRAARAANSMRSEGSQGFAADEEGPQHSG